MIDWTKIQPGHYQMFGRFHGRVFRIDVKSVEGDWQLIINDIFRGSFTTARDAKARAQHLVDRNDFSLNRIGD
jgi:hypothetical protein